MTRPSRSAPTFLLPPATPRSRSLRLTIPSVVRRARLRREFSWPYPQLDPSAWYRVRDHAYGRIDRGWIWLETAGPPVYALEEHFEITYDPEATAPGGPFTPERQARLRPDASALYRGVRSGAWIRARDLARKLFGEPPADAIDRRHARLPAEHFEFRYRPRPRAD